MIQAPSVPEDGIVNASLERSGAKGELMLAFAAVITPRRAISRAWRRSATAAAAARSRS